MTTRQVLNYKALVGESYTTSRGISDLFKDGIGQFRALRRMKNDARSNALRIVKDLRELHLAVETELGIKPVGLDTLEIGHGQLQSVLAYFSSLGNRAVGIDLDVVPRSLFDFPTLWFQLRTNGPLRCIKTIGREATGVSQAFRREVCKELGWHKWPKYRALWMNAGKTTFADKSFDLITSFDVLEHVDDPEAVLKELYRITKPGGGAHLLFLHYCNANALHDLRTITESPNAPLPWAHLIPELKHTVNQGAYVNTLRLGDWTKLAERLLPGSRVEAVPDVRPELRTALAEHRKLGYLKDFVDSELLSARVKLIWRKSQ